MNAGFQLDSTLASDSRLLAQGPLSQLRLMDDLRYPWLLLVPRVPGAGELTDLDDAATALLVAEIRQASQLLRAGFAFDKLNVAALGNIVAQLHVHLVARTRGDPAWPAPVWGQGVRQPLSPAQFEHRSSLLPLPPFWTPARQAP